MSTADHAHPATQRDTSAICDRRDLDFMLYEVLGVDRLCAYPRFTEHTRETFDSRSVPASISRRSRRSSRVSSTGPDDRLKRMPRTVRS